MTKKLNIPKIPLLSIPDTPLTASSQNHLPISDICEDVVLFKDGGAALVMESTSLNFSLLSEKEQEAVIAAYSALLNSLSFSIQIMVRSQKKDISSYMNYLDESAKKIANPGLYRLMQSYRKFIVESIKKKNVLGKRFFVVLPFSALELGVAKSVLSITKGKGTLPYPKSYVIKKAKVVLYPRRDHLIRQMGRLGIKLRQLGTEEIVGLYHEIYNPVKPEERKKEF
ncbi:hypothetical protein COX03_03175 [Candidatus Woesebacteria bacterium CG22_combo_CG10-13_8_21_14_all_39_10]|uniref:Uncharacterized protein n=3 Tax=Candidatus Woeseibacteriota TaxID=1752722 RepID=A0A2M7X944_9BACT|nr:MAG: hypothetical protein COX03_03175 [Candidatus Woesebacteria bacterium CG22_combo_CG10-13_8_21_14_all_39_10]PIZ47464.1 MAG: hypothetical protein COY29_05180 [Candidatus Woesebacteria bacterium CG_4_10_14_0_2_um_filter_39_14]PJA42685.1 MAG: hypothetical protein CO176_01875 [Candidatus Woesebacteria bacterium CG_4_9_14_3_um_filter_39_10]